jgi:hypothetical protein
MQRKEKGSGHAREPEKGYATWRFCQTISEMHKAADPLIFKSNWED